MSWFIFPMIAQKISPCLCSQKGLWTLHCTFQKSFLVLGSLNPDADGVDSRRNEDVKAKTMLCALAHEKQHFELNAHNAEAPQISTCVWKTLLHICFFHMPVLDGCEIMGFSWLIPEIFWNKCKGINPALPCASVNRMNISHWRRTSNDFRKQPNKEIHSVALLVEGIYSMLWTIHLVTEFKWGARVGVERAGKHSSLVKMKEWV